MNTHRIIDGKAIAAQVREGVAKDVAQLKSAHGFLPGLACSARPSRCSISLFLHQRPWPASWSDASPSRRPAGRSD